MRWLNEILDYQNLHWFERYSKEKYVMFESCHRWINANEIIPIVSKYWNWITKWFGKQFNLLQSMHLYQFDEEQSLVILLIVKLDLQMNQDHLEVIEESFSLVRTRFEYLNVRIVFQNFEFFFSILPWMMFQSILFNWLAYSIRNDWQRSFNMLTYRMGKRMNSPISCRMDSIGI